jgi:hypothetical protein
MISKQRLFTNMFLRNMMADFGNRSADYNTPGKYIPYFQYRIGCYQPDYYLYFPKEPFCVRYKNEVFNKLQEYWGYDMIKYLDFHYAAYEEKADFLRFLQYETSDRLERNSSKSFRQKLQATLKWIVEKGQELRNIQQKSLKGEIVRDIRESLFEGDAGASQNEIETAAQALSKKLNDHIEQIVINTEERFENLTGSLVTGHIELNNHNHLEKIVQLLVLLQTVQAPRQISKPEQLFKKFSATDIASLLHLHFEAFKNKKINTLQVKIREAGERLNPNNPKVEKLTRALQEFFY